MLSFFKHKPKTEDLQLSLALGGYYTYCQSDNTYHILRLVDIDEKRVHIMLYEDAFDHKPHAGDLAVKDPVIMHVPQPLSAVFEWRDLTPLKITPLSQVDVLNYAAYLRAFGRDPDRVSAYVAAVVKNSGVVHKFSFRKDGETVTVRIIP